MKRASGVLLPVSCLPGGYSSGNFGKAATAFIDFLTEAGFSYWQMLPFCVTDGYHSPYASASAFSGNPWFVDPEALLEQGLITKEELEEERETISYTCDFDRLTAKRLPLFQKASSRVKDFSPIDAFLEKHPYIKEFCLFAAKSKANGGIPFRFWEEKRDDEEYRMWALIEYLFFTQWEGVRAYAAEKGVKLIGDIPIYVAYESADVCFHPELFALDENHLPTGVAGVPPDYFSEDGQYWGNPLYQWERMEKDGFLWWRDRLRHMLSLFDGVRLDHFRGFDTYYEIPYGAESAKEGKWQKGPGCPFIDMLKEEAGGALLIAEDLGERMSTVDALLTYSGFPGMRVFSFAFEGQDGSRHLPYDYPANSVAYTGTHDNNTLLGYLFSVSPEKRRAVFDYCGYCGERIEEGCLAVLNTLLASHSDLVIFPIQDLLLYGEDTRMNTPGKAEGNWGFRITKEQLSSIDTAFFYQSNKRYGRI